jgi:AraC family transcriptional regulator
MAMALPADFADGRLSVPAENGLSPDPAAAPRVLEVLFDGPSVRLGAWRCPVRSREWSDARIQGGDSLAFPRDVPFAIDADGETVVADRNVVLFHSAGVPYRTSHPFGTGDRGLVATLPPGFLADSRDAPPRLHGLRSPHAHVLQEVLFRRAAGSGEPDAVHALLRGLVDEALRSARLAPACSFTRPLRIAIEGVRARLGRDLHAKLGLGELAERAGYSPFHVARMFRRTTGLPLRRYRLRARLFAALPRILEPRSDLMQIGIDLGFSSHSHLTATFRGEFGFSPSELRRLVLNEPLRTIAAVLRSGPAAP